MSTAPRRKGLRSLLKGLAIIGSYIAGFGALGAIAVGLYNTARSIYGAYKRKAVNFLGYGAGALLSFAGFPIDVLYGAGEGVTGSARIIRNKPMFYDNPLGSAAPYATKTGMI